MTASTHRTASPFTVHTDPRGRRIVRLDVGVGKTASLLLKDWERVRLDFGPTWYLTGDGKGRYYVAANRPECGGLITLARVIMDARPGQSVKYRDGNRLNLTRENLYVAAGASRRPAAEPMRDAA